MSDRYLGADAAMYIGDRLLTEFVTFDDVTWTPEPYVRDVTLDLTSGENDETTRDSEGWQLTGATLRSAAVTFELLLIDTDTNYDAILAAFLGQTKLSAAFFDKDILEAGRQGIVSNFVVTAFGRPEPTNGVITLPVTMKISGETSWNTTASSSSISNNTHNHDSRYYTKTLNDALLADKSDIGHTHTEADVTDLDKYTTAAVDALLAAKSDTTHTHIANDITTGEFADARISESSVTQHQAALSIADSQISDWTTADGRYDALGDADGAVATHSALDTGVHGVGASTVASVADIATAVADYLPLAGGTMAGAIAGVTTLTTVDVDFSAQASDIKLIDNTANALQILEGANEVIGIDTTDGSEKITLGYNLDVTGGAVVSGGSLLVGVYDTNNGAITLYGNATGSATGGFISMHLAADYDTTIDRVANYINADNLLWAKWVNGTGWVSLMNLDLSDGNLRLYDGDLEIDADNKGLVLGEGQDSWLYDDDSDLIIDVDKQSATGRTLKLVGGNFDVNSLNLTSIGQAQFTATEYLSQDNANEVDIHFADADVGMNIYSGVNPMLNIKRTSAALPTYATVDFTAPATYFKRGGINVWSFSGGGAVVYLGDAWIWNAGYVKHIDNNYLYFGTGVNARIYYNAVDLIIEPDNVGVGIVKVTSDVAIDADNKGVIFGADQDASILYDGTDLVIDPKVVGTGVAKIDGVLYAVGDAGIGVGTSTPSARLQVQAGTGAALLVGDSEYDWLAVDANGYTGVGTSSPDENFSVQNKVLVTTAGDLYFKGAGTGLLCGSCSGYHMGWSQVAVQNTWYNVSDASFIDGSFNGVTHDGSGELTVTVAGLYQVNVALDAEISASNNHLEIGFEVSGSGSAETEGIVCKEAPGAAAELTMSTTALLDLAADATLELCVRTTDAGTPTITVDCVSLNCVLIAQKEA